MLACFGAVGPTELADRPNWRIDRAGYTSEVYDVYSWCMARVRTNIELESTYLEVIMDRFGVHTKTEAVDLALRHLAGQPMSRDEALAMRGARAIGEVPVDVPPAAAPPVALG